MALDGLVVRSIAHELNTKLVGGKIDRVHQPENDEILLYVRNNRENFKVVLSSSSSNPRVYIANKYNKENPLKAPMFCMLLRKHLQGGIITDITQVGFERIIKISIESYDELKDKSKDCTQLCCRKMQISAGEKIMITGESGCGKSTLLKLMQGFYPVENEKIKIYGKDINEYELDELRNIITYVPQDCYLFEGTVAENIAFGWNGENAPSMDMILVAAKEAYADKFIEHLSDGYNTKVTAGGTNLSGGQRQRIAIARAFMKNAPIVLMDEPLSALDTYSENVLLKAMKALLKNKTVIMV